MCLFGVRVRSGAQKVMYTQPPALPRQRNVSTSLSNHQKKESLEETVKLLLVRDLSGYFTHPYTTKEPVVHSEKLCVYSNAHDRMLSTAFSLIKSLRKQLKLIMLRMLFSFKTHV
jgi:hypothetical protein